MRSSALRRTLFPTAVEVYHLHTSFPTPVGDEDAPSQDEEVVAADLPYVINPSAPLTARDEGDQCFIDMAALSVVWPDIDAVSYEAVSIGGLLHSTLYHVYFVDSDRDGTRDSCVFVTLTRIEIYEDVGTVYVGSVTTPAPGGASTQGGGGGGNPPPDPEPPDPDLEAPTYGGG